MPGTVVISAIGGTAGVGKTALAVHWAHQAAGEFPGGQLYVNLRGYDLGPQVAAADAQAGFLRALGVPGKDIPPKADERAARYRSLLAGRQKPAHHAHRREDIPHRPVEQPLRPVRRLVSGMLGDRRAIALRQPADQRTHILARLQPRLGPHKTRPQHRYQLSALPGAQPRPILAAAAASDFVVLTNHMIARRLPRTEAGTGPASRGYPSSRP
jgi:hypothetical protein